MPSSYRVTFAPRKLDDEEDFVVRKLRQHILRCAGCKAACRKGSPLVCERGVRRLRGVHGYLYWKAGKIFSEVDKKKGDPLEIKISDQNQFLLDLLKPRSSTVRPSPQRGLEKFTYHFAKAPSEYDVEVRPVSTEKPHRSATRGPSRTTERSQRARPNSEGDTLLVYAWLPAMKIPIRIKRSDLETT